MEIHHHGFWQQTTIYCLNSAEPEDLFIVVYRTTWCESYRHMKIKKALSLFYHEFIFDRSFSIFVWRYALDLYRKDHLTIFMSAEFDFYNKHFCNIHFLGTTVSVTWIMCNLQTRSSFEGKVSLPSWSCCQSASVVKGHLQCTFQLRNSVENQKYEYCKFLLAKLGQ